MVLGEMLLGMGFSAECGGRRFLTEMFIVLRQLNRPSSSIYYLIHGPFISQPVSES